MAITTNHTVDARHHGGVTNQTEPDPEVPEFRLLHEPAPVTLSDPLQQLLRRLPVSAHGLVSTLDRVSRARIRPRQPGLHETDVK